MTPERAEAWAKGLIFAMGMTGIASTIALVLVAVLIWWTDACSVGIYPIC